jgi:hypothetical protein
MQISLFVKSPVGSAERSFLAANQRAVVLVPQLKNWRGNKGKSLECREVKVRKSPANNG